MMLKEIAIGGKSRGKGIRGMQMFELVGIVNMDEEEMDPRECEDDDECPEAELLRTHGGTSSMKPNVRHYLYLEGGIGSVPDCDRLRMELFDEITFTKVRL
jgi:hypothetical protein